MKIDRCSFFVEVKFGEKGNTNREQHRDWLITIFLRCSYLMSLEYPSMCAD